MNGWNLKELKDLIRSKYSDAACSRAEDLIYAIDWKLMAQGRYLILSDDVLNRYFKGREIDTVTAANLSIGRSIEAGMFQHANNIKEICVVAAVTTAHSTPEIIAQLASLLFATEPVDVHKVTLSKTIEMLSDGGLKTCLRKIHVSPEYKYISAFTNVTKHINLVRPTFKVRLVAPEYHGVVFREFNHKGKSFPQRRDVEVIADLNSLSEMCVRAGMEINAALR